jgi:hypothetical protein
VSDSSVETPDASAKSGGRWSRMSGRAKMLLGVGATVVVLAGVILGVSAFSATDSSETATTQLTDVQRSALAYQKGLAALEAGETTAAVAALKQAVELDPANQAAADALARAVRAASAGTGGDAGGPDESGDPEPGAEPEPEPQPEPEPEDSAFLKPVADLKVLLPVQADGFALGTPTGTEEAATLAGTPNDPELIASRSLWTVHDRETPAGAAKFLTAVSKSLYAEDAATATIDGAKAYFGTDGTRFATMVYVRGRYVFEVVLTSLYTSPAELRTEAEDASAAFPDSL